MIDHLNLEVLVEEPSAERALRILLPKIVPDVPFEIRNFRGKDRLLKELPNRLRGYASWVEDASTKVVVVVDRDDDDCLQLKHRLDQIAVDAKLRTPSVSVVSFQILNRIVVEESEEIAKHMDVESNRSRSFQVFRDGLRRLVSEES